MKVMQRRIDQTLATLDEINAEIFPQILKLTLTEEIEINPAFSDFKHQSIISGYPALLLYFSDYGEIFLDMYDLDVCYHHLIIKIKKNIESEGISSLSLFDGLSGVCQSLAIANSKRGKYEKILISLESYLVERLQKEYLLQIERDVDLKQPSHPNYYDLVVGLTGIASYFLNFAITSRKVEVLEKILLLLVKRCAFIEVQSEMVPGWYSFSHYEFLKEDRSKFPNGSFNMGLAHGVTGILAVLSISAIKGYVVENQMETIRIVSDWLLHYHSENGQGYYWADRVSFEEVVCNKKKKDLFRDGWCYGTAGVARTLYLAGKSLKSNLLKEKASAAFLEIFKRPKVEWGLDSLSFCHGFSGLLTLTNLMEKDTCKAVYRTYKCKILQFILDQYDSKNIYGFFQHENQSGKVELSSKLEFLRGVLGVLSSLNSVAFDKETNWEKTFLIK